MAEVDRPLPSPAGTFTDIVRVFRQMVSRHREQQPAVNQAPSDTITGSGSGDQ